MTELAIEDVDAAGTELIAALDDDLRERYPGVSIHGIDANGFRAAGGVFLVGRTGGVAVACGALRPLDEKAIEVKRMFVRRTERRRGYARAILAALEQAAVRRGYQTIRLETGYAQPEALQLYASAGYRRIPCFGEYAADPRGCCFEKSLGSRNGRSAQ